MRLDANIWIGKKQHSSDQWWETAFDNQLKNLDVSGSSKNGGVTVKQNMPISTALGMEKMSKYYIAFVRGGVLEGDVERLIVEESVEDISTGSEEERKLERKREKKAGKSRKKRKEKETDGKRKKRTVTERKGESKEERRGRKRLKRLVDKELALLKNGR